MGKKRTRNTAKTGDKALYKSRNLESFAHKRDDSDDDAMYSKVDKFYNEQDEEDFIELSKGRGDDGDSDDDDEIMQQEAVMDLGGGGMSSSEEEEDEEDEVESDSGEAKPVATINQHKASMTANDSSSSSESDEKDEENVRDWGKRKSVYYHGDTDGLEIGQDQDDAFVEEEAAREVHAARMKEMSEEDYVLSNDEGEDTDMGEMKEQAEKVKVRKVSEGVATTSQRREAAKKWTKREQRTFLQQHHPEFLPLVNHFRDVVQDFDQRTNVAVKALYESKDSDANTAKNVGATKEGERYLLSRALVQSSTALNLAVYMLLKSEYAEKQQPTTSGGLENDYIMNSHPVLDHLQKLNSLAEKMEETVQDSTNNPLKQQLDHLVKAYALMEEEAHNDDSSSASSGNAEHKRTKDKHDDSEESEPAEEDDLELNCKPAASDMKPEEVSSASSSSDDGDLIEDEAAAKAKQEADLMNEARFALRLNEVGGNMNVNKKSRRRAAPDFGESQTLLDNAANQASRSLANTINSLEQRFAHTKKAAKKNAVVVDHLDEFPENDDDAVRRGLELMETELGKASDDGETEDNGKDGYNGSDDSDDNEFYHQMKKASQTKKKQRKDHYAVAPKFPRLEEDIEGERAISRNILKNRGLVPHKSKLNRNPRVKKREQYRKALIRRKGAVRAVRDPQEGHAYGGEETGIKSGVRRSRNLS